MTRQVKLYAKCRDCDEDAICPECGEKIPRFSPFSDWLRNLPVPYDSSNVSNQNLDYVWHNYRENWFITIEEKQNGGRCPSAQEDTHTIVSQFLTLASDLLRLTYGYVKSTMRNKWLRVEYKGHYVVVFENTNPDDSVWIHINEYETDKDGLLQLLKIGKLEAA